MDQERSLTSWLIELPTVAVDLSALSERDRQIVEARHAGYTLAEIGNDPWPQRRTSSAERSQSAKADNGRGTAACVSDLTQRGDVLPFRGRYARGDATFRDSPPQKHAYREPELSAKIVHHRTNAWRLADLRGNEPLKESARSIWWASNSWMGAPMTPAQLLEDLEVIAIWKRDWQRRAKRAQLIFETIGLSTERHDEIIREGRALTALCRVYAEGVPGCLGEPKEGREAA